MIIRKCVHIAAIVPLKKVQCLKFILNCILFYVISCYIVLYYITYIILYYVILYISFHDILYLMLTWELCNKYCLNIKHNNYIIFISMLFFGKYIHHYLCYSILKDHDNRNGFKVCIYYYSHEL